MNASENSLTPVQGAFLKALRDGRYRAGTLSPQLPKRFSLKDKMPPVYQQAMRGTCVANAVTALVEYYEDCKTRLSVQFLHEMTKAAERAWLDRNLEALRENRDVDAEFAAKFPGPVSQIRVTTGANGVGSPAALAFLNAFARQLEGVFGCGAGSEVRRSFEALRECGVCRYSLWPYANFDASGGTAELSVPPGSREDALKHRVSNGLYLLRAPNNVDEIRGIIAGANGRRPMPVCVGLVLFEGCDGTRFRFPRIDEAADGTVTSREAVKDVHEVLLTGYEDDKSAPGGGWFEVRNSWGADWGNDGYGKVPYAYVECFATEAGTILQDMVDYVGDGYGGLRAQDRVNKRGGGRIVGAAMALALLAGIGYGGFWVVKTGWPVERIKRVERVERVEQVESIEPVESVEPIEPIEPIEQVEKIEPIKPIEPIEPPAPVKQIETPEPVEQVELIEQVESIEQIESVEQIEPIDPVKSDEMPGQEAEEPKPAPPEEPTSEPPTETPATPPPTPEPPVETPNPPDEATPAPKPPEEPTPEPPTVVPKPEPQTFLIHATLVCQNEEERDAVLKALPDVSDKATGLDGVRLSAGNVRTSPRLKGRNFIGMAQYEYYVSFDLTIHDDNRSVKRPVDFAKEHLGGFLDSRCPPADGDAGWGHFTRSTFEQNIPRVRRTGAGQTPPGVGRKPFP